MSVHVQVRGQCPKVAKQDKKKKPKGRAGKRITVSGGVARSCARTGPSERAGDTAPSLRVNRVFFPLLKRRKTLNSYAALPPPPMQYNRRFVNVVVGLGKKRSPNSNAT